MILTGRLHFSLRFSKEEVRSVFRHTSIDFSDDLLAPVGRFVCPTNLASTHHHAVKYHPAWLHAVFYYNILLFANPTIYSFCTQPRIGTFVGTRSFSVICSCFYFFTHFYRNEFIPFDLGIIIKKEKKNQSVPSSGKHNSSFSTLLNTFLAFVLGRDGSGQMQKKI